MNRFFIIIAFLFSLTSYAKQPVIVGSKMFQESYILAEMIAVLIEEKFNHPVKRKINLGGTQIVFDAINQGGIDIYPEYTGTGLVMILKNKDMLSPAETYNKVKYDFSRIYNLNWSQPLGFNNTYALAIRKNDPKLAIFNKVSDLISISSDLKVAAPHEFMEREDGFNNFKNTYGLQFQERNVSSMEAGLMYSAIENKKVNVIMAYSTDGRIRSSNLKTLEDDLNFFPPYDAAFLYRKSLELKFPQLQQALSLIEGKINQSTMTELNYEVDHLKKDPKVVAKNFLIERGILSGKITQVNADNFLAFFVTKKDYFIKILIEHLLLSFIALFLAILIAIPLGILTTRYESLARAIFPIVNIIQTIPSLALLGFLVPLIGIGFTPALIALFLYSLLPLLRNTHEGIRGVDPMYIEVSRGLGLTDYQILKRVEVPLALPIIIAGVRTAAVLVIGTATLASMVGAGGLGDPIFRGVATVNTNLILLGALPAALLAIIVDKGLAFIEKLVISPGLQINSNKK